MLKYDEQDFSIRFYMRNTILNQIQLGILFLEEIWSFFFVKFFHCLSALFLLVFPSLSKESNIIYADEHRISPDLSLLFNILTFGIYWSFIKERRVEKFFTYKRCKQQFYNYYLHYLLCFSGLFFGVITCFYFDTNSISTARFKEKAAV